MEERKNNANEAYRLIRITSELDREGGSLPGNKDYLPEISLANQQWVPSGGHAGRCSAPSDAWGAHQAVRILR